MDNFDNNQVSGTEQLLPPQQVTSQQFIAQQQQQMVKWQQAREVEMRHIINANHEQHQGELAEVATNINAMWARSTQNANDDLASINTLLQHLNTILEAQEQHEHHREQFQQNLLQQIQDQQNRRWESESQIPAPTREDNTSLLQAIQELTTAVKQN
ncbi:hypothetical protein BDC45DRAFT_570068 [Circinella umbellata]|nr:hypothetical protein BDC45DRAFT_570068 [Circinella umbellata]